MNEPMDRIEAAFDTSMRRREFLTKAAAAGAVAWATPVILSRPAYAADGGGGTPNCQPSFMLQCLTYDCLQGGKVFPGFRVVPVGTPPPPPPPNPLPTPPPVTCPCSPATPPTNATMCIKITPAPPSTTFMCDKDTVIAYGNGTDCRPLQQHPSQPDVRLNTGNWECFDPSKPVFFSKLRSGSGAISNLASCDLTFRVAIWAGKCPDKDSTDEAFSCQTFIATIRYDSATDTVDCTPTAANPTLGFHPAPAADSLCTTLPPNDKLPPCCPPVKPVGPNQGCCS